MDISELQEEPTPKGSRSKPITPKESHEKSPRSPIDSKCDVMNLWL